MSSVIEIDITNREIQSKPTCAFRYFDLKITLVINLKDLGHEFKPILYPRPLS
jgi:hypothetical protein